MRTRLDEIVEEERCNAPGGEAQSRYSIAAVSRIAERAYRLGAADQMVAVCLASTSSGVAGYVRLDWINVNVQPAPAGEKPQARCVHGIVFTDWCHRCCDRRKGERRKCEAWVAFGRYTRYMRYDNETWTTSAAIDRRSGKDRRKK